MPTTRQKKRVLNRMYYIQRKIYLQKHENYATNSDEVKAVCRAYFQTCVNLGTNKYAKITLLTKKDRKNKQNLF